MMQFTDSSSDSSDEQSNDTHGGPDQANVRTQADISLRSEQEEPAMVGYLYLRSIFNQYRHFY